MIYKLKEVSDVLKLKDAILELSELEETNKLNIDSLTDLLKKYNLDLKYILENLTYDSTKDYLSYLRFNSLYNSLNNLDYYNWLSVAEFKEPLDFFRISKDDIKITNNRKRTEFKITNGELFENLKLQIKKLKRNESSDDEIKTFAMTIYLYCKYGMGYSYLNKLLDLLFSKANVNQYNIIFDVLITIDVLGEEDVLDYYRLTKKDKKVNDLFIKYLANSYKTGKNLKYLSLIKSFMIENNYDVTILEASQLLDIIGAIFSQKRTDSLLINLLFQFKENEYPFVLKEIVKEFNWIEVTKPRKIKFDVDNDIFYQNNCGYDESNSCGNILTRRRNSLINIDELINYLTRELLNQSFDDNVHMENYLFIKSYNLISELPFDETVTDFKKHVKDRNDIEIIVDMDTIDDISKVYDILPINIIYVCNQVLKNVKARQFKKII